MECVVVVPDSRISLQLVSRAQSRAKPLLVSHCTR